MQYQCARFVLQVVLITKWLQAVVLSEKPPIAGENEGISPALLETLLYDIGTLASVYHKPAETFIAGKKFGADNVSKAMTE